MRGHLERRKRRCRKPQAKAYGAEGYRFESFAQVQLPVEFLHITCLKTVINDLVPDEPGFRRNVLALPLLALVDVEIVEDAKVSTDPAPLLLVVERPVASWSVSQEYRSSSRRVKTAAFLAAATT